MHKKEPYEYIIDIFAWVLLTPGQLTTNSNKKSIRIVGMFLCFPWALTWIITGIPVIFAAFILLIIQMCHDA